MCSATSRVLVHASIKDQLIEKILVRISLVKIGDTLSEEMVSYTGGQMGPVINKAQYDKIWRYIEDAKKLGCRSEGEGNLHPGSVTT